jgi:hypothetical protein
MTRKRFIRKRRGILFTSETSRRANRVRWSDENRKQELTESARRFAEIQIENLPKTQGDVIGVLQWTEFRTGKVRRWTVKIGNRIDRITVETPQTKPTRSMGWSEFLTGLRKRLVKS